MGPPQKSLSHHFMTYTAIVLLCFLPSQIEGLLHCKANDKTVIPLTPNEDPSYYHFYPVAAVDNSSTRLTNMTCLWNLTAPPGHILVVKPWILIRNNDSDACPKGETFQIFDGPNNSSKLLYSSCSKLKNMWLLQETFFTSGRYGVIELKSPSYFKLNTTVTLLIKFSVATLFVCSGGEVNILTAFANSSVITNPYKTYGYPRNASCAWRITAPPGQIIAMKIDAQVMCSVGDRLEIYDSEKEDPKFRLAKVCYATKQTFFSVGNVVYVVFSSNTTYQSSSKRTFTINYSGMQSVCSGGEVNNFTASANSSVITNPYETYGYPRNASCAWRITAPPGQIIALKIKAKVMCSVGDRLEIYDSEKEDPENHLTKICSTFLKQEVFYSVNHVVYVVFSSNSTYQPSSGVRTFTIHYSSLLPGTSCSTSNSVEQNQNILIHGPDAGALTSPNFPNPFPTNLDCKWKFVASPGQVVKVYFDTMNINVDPMSMCDFDKFYLRVIDGYRMDVSPYLRRVRCNYMHESLLTPSFFALSTGRKLAVVFHVETKVTVSGYGFNASYTFESLDSSGTCGESRNGIINLKGQGASFSTPGYDHASKLHPKNMTCLWNITADPGFIIEIKIISSELTMDCESEFVKFYDGATLKSPILKIMCSKKSFSYLYSSGNQMLLEMKTSSSEKRGKGFHMTYRAVKYDKNNYVCSRSRIDITESPAKVVSHWYPISYPNNVYCNWIFTAPFGSIARVNITHLHLQDSKDCADDYVKVYGSRLWFSPLHRTLCGKPLTPILITSSERKLSIRMKTDWRGQYPGFKAIFDSFEDVSFGDCKVQGQDNRISLTNSSGVFFSPLFSKGIPSNMMCSWVINATSYIYLKFVSFDLDYFCRNDSLIVVRDGPSEKSQLLGSYCGDKKPPSIFSSGKQLWVRFTSKNGNSYDRGFKATYRFVSTLPSSLACREGSHVKLHSSSGEIASHHYPLVYENDVTCRWTITVSDSKRIKLTFNSFNIQQSSGCSADYVEVFDGASMFSDSLGKFCGDKIPEPVKSSGEKMYIVFKTDKTGQYPGFKASFESELSVRTIILIAVFSVIGVGAILSLIGWCCKTQVYRHNPEAAPTDGAASTAGSNIELTAKS